MPSKDNGRRGTGTPRNTLATVLDRVVIEPDGCCRWTGTLDIGGYGQVGWHGRVWAVHRLLYQHFIGPVPPGLTLDHLCRNRACCNPWHLEPVTNHQNILRGTVPSANRELCKNGVHDITTVGSLFTDSDGCERCVECRRESKRRYAERHAVYA